MTFDLLIAKRRFCPIVLRKLLQFSMNRRQRLGNLEHINNMTRRHFTMRQSPTKQKASSRPRRSTNQVKREERRKKRPPASSRTVRAIDAPAPKPTPSPVLSALLPLPPQKRGFIWSEQLPAEEQFSLLEATPVMPWTGSRRLLLGVLQDALRTFFQYRSERTRQGKRIFSETQSWLWSPEQDWLYSFENICAHLRLDPAYIRQGLQHFLQTTRPTAVIPRRSTIPSQRRPFRLVSGPGTRIPRKTHDSVRRQNVG
jgi:hypothetical protein